MYVLSRQKGEKKEKKKKKIEHTSWNETNESKERAIDLNVLTSCCCWM